MAAGAKRDRCRECGERFPSPGQLSKQGYCAECGPRRAIEQQRQLAAKSGPYYEAWKERCRAAFAE